MPDPHGIAIYCDDVRQEIDGKITIVGAYNEGLTVKSDQPPVLPKIGIVIFAHIPVLTTRKYTVRIVYRSGDKDDILVDEEEIIPDDITLEGGELFAVRIVIVLSPFRVRSGGVLRSRIRIGGMTVKLGALKINCLSDQAAPDDPPSPHAMHGA